MTTKPVAAQPYDAAAEPVRAFPDYPPRDDMQNAIHLHKPSHQTALSRHLGDEDTTIVLSEMPLGWNPEHTAGVLIPDLMVAFNVDPAAGIAQRGYAINDRGKPPDFVLEVASLHTARNDETVKRRGYAGYRVPEYWRFDPSGRYYRNRLAGDRLVSGEYQPIQIVEIAEGVFRGFSTVLNLYVCWEHGLLRWYDPVAERYLLTHDEEADGRIAAENERDLEREARIAEREARITEREARIAEREARIAEREARITAEAALTAAERQRDDERAAREALEERIRQLEAEHGQR